MAVKKTDVDKMAYVRVNYGGYIPILGKHGPLKGTFIDKDKIRELIMAGYDVQMVNRTANPYFYDVMEDYRRQLNDAEYRASKAAKANPLAGNPNAATKRIVDTIKSMSTVSVGQTDDIKNIVNTVLGGNDSGVTTPEDSAIQGQIGSIDNQLYNPNAPESVEDDASFSDEVVDTSETYNDAIDDLIDSESGVSTEKDKPSSDNVSDDSESSTSRKNKSGKGSKK